MKRHHDATILSPSRLMIRSLRYYWRTSCAVAIGVAVAVAVLTGSLVVGDSVRGSLREIALERLGRTDYALLSASFFDEALAERLSASLAGAGESPLVVPALILDGTARNPDPEAAAPDVTILGVRDDFWRLGDSPAQMSSASREVLLNRDLADDLGVKTGEDVIVSFGRQGDAPPDALFGRRSLQSSVGSLRAAVSRIIPSSGLGDFSLRMDRPRPRNIYVPLSVLQEALRRPGRANAILLSSSQNRERVETAVASSVTLDDYGLRIIPNPTQGYDSLESAAVTLPQPVVDAATDAAKASGLRCKLTSVYLANTIRLVREGGGDTEVPYSTVAALDTTALTLADGGPAPMLAADDILLDQWAADDLGAKVGDRVEISYYVPRDNGQLDTASRTFVLRGIVRMSGAAVDRGLVPTFEGITDAHSMADWDPPFPIDLQRIRPKDEDYWNKYGPAPKAFVSPVAARDFWQAGADNAAAWVTSLCLEGGTSNKLAEFRKQLLHRLTPGEMGIVLRPVKDEALRAAKGSTDYGMLFLSMSMFLVVAAAMLVALLLRLTIERRANQFGILLAAGFEPTQAARALVGEGIVLSVLGAIAGVPLGVGYASFIIRGLRTWWTGLPAEALAKAGNMAFSLHVSAVSLALGAAAGVLVSLLAMQWAVRALRKTPVLALLAGWRAMTALPQPNVAKRAGRIGLEAFVLAIALLILSAVLGLLSPTIAFFGAGAAMLVGSLAMVCAQLQREGKPVSSMTVSLPQLAWRSASGNWVRSLLTVGLLAAASFIIVAVAANQNDLSRLDTSDRNSGAGGFTLLARTSVPLVQDPATEAGRRDLPLSSQADAALAKARIVSLRTTTGDDISCLNLQRPAIPRVVAVPRELIDRGGFAFSAHANMTTRGSPWTLLESQTADGTIPAFADATSAQWILHVKLGDEIPIPSAHGGQARLRIVGLLTDSIFASELLISEAQFRRHFGPTGYRLFLVETTPENEKAVGAALREGLGKLGISVSRTADVLAGFARVQNTYLATFETLGGLGLLLGTIGIVVVLLRGVIERRGELAMMLALGLRHWQLGVMIVLENGLLLLLGIGIGTVTAIVAVAPRLLSLQRDVDWLWLAVVLLACFLVGLTSCTIAAGAAVRGNLLSALRSE